MSSTTNEHHENNNNNNNNNQKDDERNEEKTKNDNDANHSNDSSTFHDPYAILNTHKNASLEEIQKSYKLLSRSFHPDKQPVQHRDSAQQYFIQLKSAYDILMDPVQKFVYDEYGEHGILFLKQHSKLYKQISSLFKESFTLQQQEGRHQSNMEKNSNYNNITATAAAAKQNARNAFNEAMQNYNFQQSSNQENKPILSGSMKLHCNTTHSNLLQEGVEPFSLDVDETRIAFSIAPPPTVVATIVPSSSSSSSTGNKNSRKSSTSKIGLTCGLSSSLKSRTGEGSTDGQITLEYEPVQGTEIHANISSGLTTTMESFRDSMNVPTHYDNLSTFQKQRIKKKKQKQQQQQQMEPNVTFGTSRIMSNNTYVHASLSAPLKSLISFHYKNKRTTIQNKDSEEGEVKVEDDESDSMSNEHWLASFTSQRSLFEDKIRCTWIAGVAIPDTRLRYGMISISTNNKASIVDDDDDEDEDDDDVDNDENDNTEDGNDEDDDTQTRTKNNKKKKTPQNKQQHPPSWWTWFWSNNNNNNKQKYKPARHTLKLNLGMNHTPIQLISVKEITKDQIGTVEIGYGPMGYDFKILSTRLMSKFCKLTLGVRHVTSTGLFTLLKLERGGMNFNVPILVSTAMSREYALKSLYVTLFVGLIDAVIGENLDDDALMNGGGGGGFGFGTGTSSVGKNDIGGRSSGIGRNEKKSSHEDMLQEREKKRRDRAQQIQLMTASANAKMKKEEARKDEEGLIILMARYEVMGGDSIDVTIALQFWVMNSSLHLPSSMSKSNMLGFYDVRPEVPVQMEGGGIPSLNSLRRMIGQYWDYYRKGRSIRAKDKMMEMESPTKREQQGSSSIPTLTVRYRHKGNVYEITVLDHEELSIPSKAAMMLGRSFVM